MTYISFLLRLYGQIFDRRGKEGAISRQMPQGVLLFLALLLLLTSCREVKEKIPPPRPVRVVEVEEVDLSGDRIFPGRTRALRRVNLSFRVGGPLIERPVVVGDSVKKGEVVARIDPRDFETALADAKGELEKVQALLRFAESDYERIEKVWEEDPGAISLSYLDNKREERNQLLGSLKSIEAKVESTKNSLADTYLKSPFDGIVVETFVENHEFVKAKQSIMRLLDLSEIEMMIDVPEGLVREIVAAKTFDVQFDTIPEKVYSARLKEIGTEASSTTRTFPVTLLIEQPSEFSILAGMAGRATIASSKEGAVMKRRVIVPSGALFSDKELKDSFVFVLDEKSSTLTRREVKLGELTLRGRVVEEGLQPGERVVTSGVSFLREGQLVRVLPVRLTSSGRQEEVNRGEHLSSGK